MAKNAKNKKQEFRRALTQQNKKELIWSAIQNKDICDLCIEADISPNCFNELDEAIWQVWIALRDFVKKRHRLPNTKELRIAVDDSVNEEHNIVDDMTFNEIIDLFDAYDEMGDEDFIGLDTAQDFVHQLLEDQVWQEVQDIASLRGKTPKNMSESLQKAVTKASFADSLKTLSSLRSFPSGYEDKHIVLSFTPFGIPFMDAYLGGGGTAGEVYCLLAPYGSCKSTLAEQMSIELALSQLAHWESNNRFESLGVVYLVSYELTREILQYRALAHVAQVSANVLMTREPLSTSSTLNDRDQECFKEQLEHGLYVPGERERKRSAERRLDLNWRIMDFSGLGEEDPSVGGGKIEEIRRYIDRDIRNNAAAGVETHVAGIFIDYVGMMAKRYCVVNGLQESQELRHILSGVVDSTRRLLSYPFKCPVMLVQQLNSQANNQRAGVIPSMTQAAESNTIAENCDFVFVAAKTTESGLTRLNCQKRRRMRGLGPVILNVRGEFGEVVEVTSTWTFNEQSKEFHIKTAADMREDEERKKRTAHEVRALGGGTRMGGSGSGLDTQEYIRGLNGLS